MILLRNLLALATLVGIGVVVLWESEERTSPGPLHPVHERIEDLQSSCESCHGPGKDDKSKSVMEGQAKAIAAGLVHPPTQSCELCHNDGSPSCKGYNQDEYVAKIAHPNPAKK